MPEHRLADFPSLHAGQKVVLDFDGKKVIVVNVAGTLRAVGAVCAHQGGPLDLGGVFDEVRARVGADGKVIEYLANEGNVVACPWHGWEYDMETGRCLWNERYRVATYRIERDGDEVYIWT